MKKSKEVAIKKNNEIDLPKIINSEVNLLVFPFFALSTKGLKNKTKTVYQEIIKKGGQKVNILWKVSANSEYGYPGPFDRRVQQAISEILSEILKEEGGIKNPIPLGSLYRLCKRMGISEYAGVNYRMIKKALEKIRATTIKSVGTFYSKEGKQWVDDNFSLYDRVVFKGKELPNSETADNNYLFLGSWYLQNLNSFYIKPIDYNYLQSIKSKIASRLYEILGVKFYGIRNKKQDFICYKYSTLCQLLPVTLHRYISLAKQQLNPGNDELKDTGFISKYEWRENGRKDWLIYYWPGERAKEEMRRAKTMVVDFQTEEYLPRPKERLKQFSKEQNALIDKLVEINISRITAEDLIINYEQQLIEKWIEAINYSNAGDKAAYLVKAIRENWQFPEEYLRERDSREERIQGDLFKEKEKAKQQKENEYLDKVYESLSLEERRRVDLEANRNFPGFLKKRLEKELKEGKLSKIIQLTLEEQKRKVIREKKYTVASHKNRN